VSPDWTRAACLGAPPDWFIVDRGQERDAARAKAICAGCPIKVGCLDFALATSTRFGIWGGTTVGQRRLLRRARRAAA
jgi:WhiB family redox-sensing transcriptional regulator